MDKVTSLITLNEARDTIDELIEKVKTDYYDQETDTRKLLIILLSVIGGLVLVAVIAYLVYSHISSGFMDDDYDDDIDSLFDDEEDDADDNDADEDGPDGDGSDEVPEDDASDDAPEVIYADDEDE